MNAIHFYIFIFYFLFSIFIFIFYIYFLFCNAYIDLCYVYSQSVDVLVRCVLDVSPYYSGSTSTGRRLCTVTVCLVITHVKISV